MQNAKRILVVEDHQESQAMLQTCLTKLGYEVIVADDGLSAEEILNEKTVDLIISDISMPRKNGLSLVSELRARGNLIPVLFISAIFKADNLPFKDLSDTEFLAKPVDLDVLKKKLKILLG